jgi:antitoxin VapB
MSLAYAKKETVNVEAERRVSLFRNGRNQAVRIPRDMELPGDEAVIRKEGERLIIEPAKTDRRGLLEFLDSLEPLDIDFPEIEDPPPEPVDFFDDE